MKATHIDNSGDEWCIFNDTEAYFRMPNGKKWYRYAFTDHMRYVKKGQIKPIAGIKNDH